MSGDVLPFEREAGSPGEFMPRCVQSAIPSSFAQGVSVLAEELGVSAAAVLLVMWQALLWRLTRAPAVTIAARLTAASTPVHARFNEQTCFADALVACQTQLGVRPQQESAGVLPYQFEYADHSGPEAENDGNCKLKLKVCGEHLALHYDGSRFRAQDVAVMAEQYVTLVQSGVGAPRAQLASLLMNSSRHQAVLRQHHICVPAIGQVDTDLVDLFEQRVVESPTAIAMVANADAVSYQELNRRANQIARHLRQLGIGPETRVALCLERNSDMLLAILAVLKAGGAYVPLDPSWPKERASWIVRESQCDVLLGPATATCHLTDLELHRVDLEQSRAQVDRYPGNDLQRLAGPDNAAYIIYTSGSTGRPKGVVVSRRSILRLFGTTRDLFDFGTADVWSMCHSYAFDYSVWEMWGAWLHGGKVVVASRVETQSPEQLYELLERERVTVLSQTPSGFRALLRELQRVPSRNLHAQVIVFGGEALEPAMLRDLHERYPDKKLINMYGITETTVHSTYKRLAAEDVNQGGRSPIGRELPDLRIYVLGQAFQEVGIWEGGEVFIAGPGLARGYLANAELTAERFLPELDGPRVGERMYRTGDLARRMPNGELEYLGRCDQQVKIRGYRIEIGEIESTLRGLNGVREAAVLLDREAEQPRLVAYLFREPGRDLAVDLLRERLLESLPSYMVPAVFVTLDTIPLTPNGKLDKAALPRTGFERPAQRAAYLAPRTQLEQAIAAIWAQELRVASVGVRDNFFDLGGHSLLLVQVQARLRAELGLDIPVIELFARPNISLLAEFVASEPTVEIPTAPTVDRRVDRSRSSRRRREARGMMLALEQDEELRR